MTDKHYTNEEIEEALRKLGALELYTDDSEITVHITANMLSKYSAIIRQLRAELTQLKDQIIILPHDAEPMEGDLVTQTQNNYVKRIISAGDNQYYDTWVFDKLYWRKEFDKIIYRPKDNKPVLQLPAPSSNGRISDFESGDCGSSPRGATKLPPETSEVTDE